MKLSDYLFCLPLETPKDDWILLSGCRGSHAVVSADIAKTVLAAQKDINIIKTLDTETLSLLQTRGFIIPDGADESKTVDALCQRIHLDALRRLNVTFIPGFSCNFNCPYCFERSIKTLSPDWFTKQMSVQTVDAVFSALEKELANGKQIDSFTLFGGEPLLPQNRDIIRRILENCDRFDAPVLVVTNGYYLDMYLDMFKGHNIDTLKITVDGTRQTHDSRRAPKNKTSFDRIMKNVREALERGIRVSLRTNVNRRNIQEILPLADHYKASGLTRFDGFSYYFKATMECFEEKGNAVTDADIMQLFDRDCSGFFKNSAYSRIYRPLRNMLTSGVACFKSEYCGAHSSNLIIDPFGRIYSCWDVLTDPRSIIGQVNTEQQQFEFNQNLSVWQDRTVNRIEYCKKCRYKLFCGGGCAAQGLVANDSMNLPFCEGFQQRFDSVLTQTARALLDEGILIRNEK